MTKQEPTNAELIAVVREWERTEFGVHKMMSVLADRLEAAESVDYDTHCPTCDAPEPTHTTACAVPEPTDSTNGASS